MSQAPVSHKDKEDLEPDTRSTQLWRMWYKQCDNLEMCWTKDYKFSGCQQNIMLAVRYTLGHYGAVKAERIEIKLEE